MELGPRDLVAQSIEKEINEGRGVGEGLRSAVYMDFRHLGRAKIMERLPQVYQLALEFEGGAKLFVAWRPPWCSRQTAVAMGLSCRGQRGAR